MSTLFYNVKKQNPKKQNPIVSTFYRVLINEQWTPRGAVVVAPPIFPFFIFHELNSKT